MFYPNGKDANITLYDESSNSAKLKGLHQNFHFETALLLLFFLDLNQGPSD